ncbi:MAG: hypothetical protein A3E01_09980 [Gammaproteobacteria bacterium RIFCSPHIGHO2_12_FULL_63_22]|nr:MAG: hypothetical protein A3E01_09980 [Gammaproteobacteria bacterium RIFCSPHIGHO2_12_FULL_63_22]
MKLDWDKVIVRIGEVARPLAMIVVAQSFATAVLLPFVDSAKLTVAGGVLTALFAVKGMDKRAEVKADAETKVAKINAGKPEE